MSKVIFYYKGIQTEIQCNINDKIKDIYKKYETKIGIDISKLYFIYNGNKINDYLHLNEIINKEDKRRNIMNILVNENDKTIIKENQIKSKEIICPKCYENILVKINEYKIILFNCKNNHEINNILLNEYQNMENIDISKVVCNKCNIKNKSNTYNNEFYRCNICKINLCPLCKSNHNNNHKIINYDYKNYICEMHNKEYNKYCKDCKLNLCTLCFKEHKSHLITDYGDIILNEEDNKKEINKLKEYINKLNNNINDIIEIFNKVKDNMNIYYNIYNNIIKYYNCENINYEILYNINEFNKYNNIIIKDINEIINDTNIYNKFKNILNIHYQMNNKNNNKMDNNNEYNNKINNNNEYNDKINNNNEYNNNKMNNNIEYNDKINNNNEYNNNKMNNNIEYNDKIKMNNNNEYKNNINYNNEYNNNNKMNNSNEYNNKMNNNNDYNNKINYNNDYYNNKINK